MKEQDDILTTGTLLWIKSGHRGSFPVPIDILNETQKQTLRSGLESNRYPPYYDSLENINVHYIWEEKHCLYELIVTDIELSLKTKRKLNPQNNILEKIPYRLTLSDMKRLQIEFVSGEVDEEFVTDILYRLPWRPWLEFEWKSKRDLIIKETCENCGETLGLTLQHTIQPRKISTIIYDIVGEQNEEFQFYIEQHKNEIELPLHKNIKKVPVCPQCGSSRVRYRIRGIRKGSYICEKTRNSVKCKHEFITPDFGLDEREIYYAEKKRISLLRDRFCLERGIYHKAAEIALEEIISYLNMDHTKTLCNKCAFIEDQSYIKNKWYV